MPKQTVVLIHQRHQLINTAEKVLLKTFKIVMFEVSMLLVVSLNRLVNAKYENNDYFKILILFYICTAHQ